MSDSSLVSFTLISPKKNSPRNHKIDTITIHHMAGNLSIETCGQLFQRKEGSSNYGVGSDGRIGLYVNEADRSWCSSSAVNDNRAVTIEVANTDAGVKNKTWEVSDAALNSTIRLVADICQRNGINKLIWAPDKNQRVSHANGANMTIHKDFWATVCPGPYLEARMPFIAEQVNAILAGGTPAPAPVPVPPDPIAKPTLRRGSKGSEVVKLQKNLNRFGYHLTEDGDFGSRTFDAVAGWQLATGLVSDGIFGPASYAKMSSLLK